MLILLLVGTTTWQESWSDRIKLYDDSYLVDKAHNPLGILGFRLYLDYIKILDFMLTLTFMQNALLINMNVTLPPDLVYLSDATMLITRSSF